MDREERLMELVNKEWAKAINANAKKLEQRLVEKMSAPQIVDVIDLLAEYAHNLGKAEGQQSYMCHNKLYGKDKVVDYVYDAILFDTEPKAEAAAKAQLKSEEAMLND